MHRQSAGSTPVAPGDGAPTFTLQSQSGRPISLSELLERGPVVLFFYPKDFSGGCTAEVCAFRDSYEVFKEAGAEVVGISADSIESHHKFAAKHALPYLLLADPGQKVSQLYGVSSLLGVLPGRVTYVIDQTGTVRLVFNSRFSFKTHAREAIRILRQAQSAR